MKGIKAFVKHLKEEAPKDHVLAYISNEEAKLLKSRGGSGKPYKYGILSFFASSPGDTGGAGGADGAGGNDASGGGDGGGTPSPGDTGGAGGVGPGSEPDPGSGDTGPGGSPTATGMSHTGQSITSFGGNLSANIASNPLAAAISPVGTVARTAMQTAQARSMMGYANPQAPMGSEGDDDRQKPYAAVTPSSTTSSSLGSAPPSFFNLSSQPVSSYTFQPLGDPYNYQNPNLYRFNQGGIVDIFSWYGQ
jgi:hypothetical protein